MSGSSSRFLSVALSDLILTLLFALKYLFFIRSIVIDTLQVYPHLWPFLR